jgi:hypothetical protein
MNWLKGKNLHLKLKKHTLKSVLSDEIYVKNVSVRANSLPEGAINRFWVGFAS